MFDWLWGAYCEYIEKNVPFLHPTNDISTEFQMPLKIVNDIFREYDDVIKWKHFPRFRGPRWIPRTKASDAELWCFLWSASE